MGIKQSTIEKCFKITSWYEGKGFAEVTGNFDGQGLSLGRFQRCWGQGSLQPMLAQILAAEGERLLPPEVLIKLRRTNQGATRDAVAFGDSISVSGHKMAVEQPWRGYFEALLTSPTGVAEQNRRDRHLIDQADQLCNYFNLYSEPALATMLDIIVQEGGIRPSLESTIQAAITDDMDEPAILDLIVRDRAAEAKAEYRSDVLARKLSIVHLGGKVHGTVYDFAKDPGLSYDVNYDDAYDDAPAPTA